jgi:hypothetical protein
MTRLVRGADGRMWTIRARVEWGRSSASDEFEHDVNGGPGAGLTMLGLLVVLAAVLVAWMPGAVVVPFWLILALVVVFLFFPIRWSLRRPWTVVAETPGDAEELPPERWIGSVRGLFKIRQAAGKIARNIEVYSAPDVEGPLVPVD